MSTTLIRVPEERRAQLKALAEIRKQTITDLIGDLISAEIDRSGLTEKIGIPRHEIDHLANGNLRYRSPVGTYEWTPEVATSFALMLDTLAVPSVDPATVLDLDAGISMKRVGTSVQLQGFPSGDKLTFPPSIAKELARRIQIAAAKPL